MRVRASSYLVVGMAEYCPFRTRVMFMGSETPDVRRIVAWSTTDVSQRRMRTGDPEDILKNYPRFPISDHIGELMKHAEEHGVLVAIRGFGMTVPCSRVNGGLVSGKICHPCHEGMGREHVEAMPDVLIQLREVRGAFSKHFLVGTRAKRSLAVLSKGLGVGHQEKVTEFSSLSER